MAQIKNVTELDFDQIKTNLKVFLSSQDKFNDYDFDGAGMNVLLDILSYNTQYNALLAHMTMNEAFLDSAQVRANAVSHAKNLGYTPRSRKAAQTKLKITVTGDNDSAPTISIPKGFGFTGQIGSNTYTFVTNAAFNATKSQFNNQYVFDEVHAYEGKLVNLTYRVDNKDEFQKFRIADPNIDTSSMLVRVRSSLTSNDYDTYTHYNNLLEVDDESKVYFLQENGNGQYEFYFGDGVLGYQPLTGRIVELTYISTNGLEGNGAKTFTANSAIGGQTSILVELLDGFAKTVTGAEKESIDSIKFNAPKLFAAQDRVVTAEDYRSVLLANFDYIEDISVWGGESNDPPVYGKTYLSIKPTDGEVLTESTKNGIERFLTGKNVGSITTEIVDPDYTYLNIDAFFKYNPNETSRTQTQLEEAVRQVIVNYNNTTLEKFDGVFRQSNILRLIDDVDQGILNSTIIIKMHKHLFPIPGIQSSYKMKFSSPIYISDSDEAVLTTNEFTVAGTQVVATDVAIAGSANRAVNIVSATTGAIVLANVGTIYPAQGLIEIPSLQIDSTELVKAYVSSDSNDIAPKFNQLVRIELDDPEDAINVTGEIDTIATQGSSGASTYTTFPRHD
jgi:hypothetical protein